MCHVTSSQVFIVGSPLEPILNATFNDQNFFHQICTRKKKNCIIFLHTSSIFAKCAILFFIWCQIVQHFKEQKKPCPQKEKQVSNVSSTPYFHH
jgi:hypothetical protein